MEKDIFIKMLMTAFHYLFCGSNTFERSFNACEGYI